MRHGFACNKNGEKNALLSRAHSAHILPFRQANGPDRDIKFLWVISMADAAQLKIDAARKALSYVEDGMKLGIGTGSTAEAFVELLAERVDNGLNIVGVPTSEHTAALCTKIAGAPLKLE